MSSSCATCRSHLFGIAAGRASDADRLKVETHLETCSACREERARWQVIGHLRSYEPSLSPAAQERVRQSLLQVAVPAAARQDRPVRALLRWPLAAAAAAACVLVTLLGIRFLRFGQATDARVTAGEVLVAGRQASVGDPIPARAALATGGAGGTVHLDGPQVGLAAGTHCEWRRDEQTVHLASGEVSVEVEPGKGHRFRVATPRFVAEVVGTRFTVTMSSVHTERGKVRVLSLDGRELALVCAGQTWRLEEPAAAAVPSPAASAPDAVFAATAPVRAGPARAAEHAHRPARESQPGPAIAQLLEEARRANAQGEAPRARVLAKEALARRPSAAAAAEASSIAAESYVVEGRKDEAIHHLRELAHTWKSQPQAESALFLVGQLESELGHKDEARHALSEYLSRYPRGLFRAEARDRLARLTPPPAP